MARPPLTDEDRHEQSWYDPKRHTWGRADGPAVSTNDWRAWYDNSGIMIRMVNRLPSVDFWEKADA